MINKWFSGCFRAAICLCVLALFTVALAGCGTLAETSDEVRIRHTLINKTNTKQMQDDIDTVLMMEQPSRLTEMHVR
jgi:hypothetical protein